MMAGTLKLAKERWGGIREWAATYGLTEPELAALYAALVEPTQSQTVGPAPHVAGPEVRTGRSDPQGAGPQVQTIGSDPLSVDADVQTIGSDDFVAGPDAAAPIGTRSDTGPTDPAASAPAPS